MYPLAAGHKLTYIRCLIDIQDVLCKFSLRPGYRVYKVSSLLKTMDSHVSDHLGHTQTHSLEFHFRKPEHLLVVLCVSAILETFGKIFTA